MILATSPIRRLGVRQSLAYHNTMDTPLNAGSSLITKRGQLQEPGYDVCLNYWFDLKEERWAPSWQEWQWSQIPVDLVPYFIVVDVTYDPFDIIYRYWGTAMARMHNTEMTGKSTKDIRSPVTRENTEDHYNEVIRQKCAIQSVSIQQTIGFDLTHKQLSLRMPMSNDGNRVDQIVSFTDWRQSLNRIRNEHEQAFG